MRRHPKASSTNTAARKGTTRARRTAFGVACLCILGLAALLGSSAPSAGADEGCPNEGIRVAQHATQVGDCRAFERVSPADKGGGDILAEGQAIIAADDGNGAIFESVHNFADSVGSGALGRTTYLSRRNGSGWSTQSVTPEAHPEAIQTFGPATHVEVFSADLTHALTIGYDLPGATGAAPQRQNYYLETTATRALEPITASQRGNGEDPIQYGPFEFMIANRFWGASEDLRHITLESPTQFLPSGTAPGYPQGEPLPPPFFSFAYEFNNVYTWDDGTLHLAGILPDGDAPPEGSAVELNGMNEAFSGTMSADGSRQSFLAAPTAGAPRQLYLRIDSSRTAMISESENPSFTEAAQKVHFEGMTPDGKYVFFTTGSSLVAADENTGPDLYRWTDGPDPAHESNLTLVTDEGTASTDRQALGGSLVGMSDDGSRVYVQAGGALHLWEEGMGIRTIDADVPKTPELNHQLTLTATDPGNGRVSPNGQWLTYIVTPVGAASGRIYLYSRQSDTVTCISCPSTAAIVPSLTAVDSFSHLGFRPRFLANDGRVFFTSAGALVPEDTNGVDDVYSYDGPTGRLSLLSSGKGDEPSQFVDASKSGDDVFFVTRDRLVPSDGDELVDLYDARVGGGFSEPEPAPESPCTGEACQAGPEAAAPPPAIASSGPARGNVKHRRKGCRKPQRRVKPHGKAYCAGKGQLRHHHRPRNAITGKGGAK